MSIYATLWQMRMPRDGWMALAEEEYVDVWAQAVPAHIGHPSHYPDGDPYADFLPPVVDYDPESDERQMDRAVVICGPLTTKGTARSHQEYENPLLVLTGTEYDAVGWQELYDRIAEALRRQHGLKRPVALLIAPDGKQTRFSDERG